MRNLLFQFIITCFLLVSYSYSQTAGGMWIPNELPVKDMQKLGLKLKPEEIFNPNKPSLEDAVVHFDGGCTAEIISSKGLLLTNHHCGFDNIQAHSTVENDLLKKGFWAKKQSDELPNKGLEVTFILDYRDVTAQVLAGVEENMSIEKKQEVIKLNSENLVKAVPKSNLFQDAIVRAYYNGNKYYLCKTETFKDVRLVGAPPSSIGNYGVDTDNWVWPRHTGDFSMFRIYADKNNQPAEYSQDNIPYTPKHYFPVSVKDIKENDFTMVYGFPGKTNEYLTAAALEQTLNTVNPNAIALRNANLKNLIEKMKQDDATRIKYAAKYASISNAWKKWSGESQGLTMSNAIAKKKLYENDFQNKVNANPEFSKYKNLIPDLNKLYQDIEPYQLAETMLNETFSVNSETFRMAIWLNNLIKSYENQNNYQNTKEFTLNKILSMQKDYDQDLDLKSTQAVWQLYTIKMNTNTNLQQVDLETLWKQSILTQTSNFEALFTKDDQLIATLKNDKLIRFVSEIVNKHIETVSPNYKSLKSQIDEKQRLYMKAQLEVMKARRFFPDANSTLRVTYGKVKGYYPKDAVYYNYQTTFDGYMEKYIPNDYEYNVLPEVRELYAKKDYGIYAINGKLPVNFIATNHTTGGNSGSPALDAYGNLIGLNFDRVWEGTMSDLYYDPVICRNIMVDTRYILWVIEKIGKAQNLINEMKIVK